MKNLNEIISSSNTPVEFPLFDGSLTVSANRHIYSDLRKKYAEIAENAYNQYMSVEKTFKTLDDLIEKAGGAFQQVLVQAIQEVVNDAISVGILTLDVNAIYDEYCKIGYVDQFNNAYNAFAEPYYEIKKALQENKQIRKNIDNRVAKINRAVNDDDFFNIEGRLDSAIDNAAEQSAASKKFKAMFENNQMRFNLQNGVWCGIENLGSYIVNYFPKKTDVKFGDWTTDDSCNKASAALNNMQITALSDEQKKAFVNLILENNPFLDKAYPVFAEALPEFTKQFVIIGDFFGSKSIIKKVNDDLIAYVNENMGSSESDLDYCKALLGQKLSEVGISKESAAPVYAVIQARAEQLDLEYRTVEGVVFDTRNEADAAKAAFSANIDVLKKESSEFITRSDYVNHINNIRALPVPQAITTLYAMQYEQKLKEFDSKCKLAALYEEANSGEKRSLKSRLSSLTSSSDSQRNAWEEVTHNGQYKLSDIMAGLPDEKGIAGAASDFGKAAAGKLKGLFGKK